MKAQNKTKWFHLRLSVADYKLLKNLQLKSTCRNLSDYVRRALFVRPIIMTYRNTSQDTIVQQLSILNGELNALGKNLNQITKKLHTLQTGEEHSWGLEFRRKIDAILLKIDDVKAVSQKIAERWLR